MTMRADRAYDLSDRNKQYSDITKGRKQDIEVRILKVFPEVPYTNGLNGFIQSEEMKMIAKYHDKGEAICSHQDLRGRHHSQKTKEKMSNLAKGRKFTQEHKNNISKNHWTKTREFSKESKVKLSNSLKNRKFTEEHKNNISKSLQIKCELYFKETYLQLYYKDLFNYCKEYFNIGSGTVKKLLNSEEPFNPRCKKHINAKGLILKRLDE